MFEVFPERQYCIRRTICQTCTKVVLRAFHSFYLLSVNNSQAFRGLTPEPIHIVSVFRMQWAESILSA